MKKVMLFVVVAVFFMSISVVEAGDRFDAAGWIKAGESIINTAVRENSRISQEQERTERERIQKARQIAVEQERRNRDVSIQQERTTETIGREQVREKRDVSVEAIKAKDGKSITYQRGGETITVDIQKTQDVLNTLATENQRLKVEIENLRLQLQKQQLQNQISKR